MSGIEDQIYLFYFILPLFLNILFTPLILHLSHRFSWFDQLDHRKVHNGEVPRLGGVGIFLAFFLSILLFLVLEPTLIPYPRALFMILGFTIIHLLGLVDDFRNIPARYKLLGQILAAGLLVYGGAKLPGFSVFGLVIPFGPFSFVLSVFWLISLSNAVNLIDGIDGLAGGTSFISALAFALLHFLMGNRLGLLFSLSLAGALLGFLVFNKPKAKIFMGDSGSLFLGFLLGSLYFVGIPMDSPLSLGGIGVTLTILIIPVIDMVAAILRRLRKGLPIFAPDREHLHHKLLDFGFSVPQILFRIYPWVLFAGLSGVYWVYSFTLIGRISVFADLALFAVWIISAFLFGHIHFKNKKLKA